MNDGTHANEDSHSNENGNLPEPNPFSAPLNETSLKKAKPSSFKLGQLESLFSIAKASFLRWEMWRLIYLLVCGAYTLGCANYFGLDYSALENYIAIAVCAVVANLCFFIAPLVHTYLTWLGLDKSLLKTVEIAILILGISVTCAGATFVIMDLATL